MVGVDYGSLQANSQSISRLAWTGVGGCLEPFYIHQMNRGNSRNGSVMMTIKIVVVMMMMIIIIRMLRDRRMDGR